MGILLKRIEGRTPEDGEPAKLSTDGPTKDRPDNTGAEPAGGPDVRRSSPTLFLLKATLWLALIALFEACVAQTGGVFRLALQALVGVMFMHGVELAHQCIHRTGTGQSRWDFVLGRVFCTPALVSFRHYFAYHVAHHKRNGGEEDVESFSYAYGLMLSADRAVRLKGMLWHILGVGTHLVTLERLVLSAFGLLQPRYAEQAKQDGVSVKPEKVEQDYRVMAGLMAVLGAASLLLRTDLLFTYWLVPLAVGYAPAHALVELPEHFKCDHPDDDATHNTRSIKGSWFSRWLTNFNGYHVPHHLDASIPMQNLRQKQEELERAGTLRHFETTYLRFYLRLGAYAVTGKWEEA